MSDSPSKRARERRKSEKRRQKKTRVENRPPETDDAEAIAARYLDRPEGEEVEGEATEEGTDRS